MQYSTRVCPPRSGLIPRNGGRVSILRAGIAEPPTLKDFQDKTRVGISKRTALKDRSKSEPKTLPKINPSIPTSATSTIHRA